MKVPEIASVEHGPVCYDGNTTSVEDNNDNIVDNDAAPIEGKQNTDSIDDNDFRTRQWTF